MLAYYLKPSIFCDEATSALTQTTNESISEVSKKINGTFGITIVLITHEMEVVQTILSPCLCYTEAGEIVEMGRVYDVFSAPKHRLTKELPYSVHSLGFTR